MLRQKFFKEITSVKFRRYFITGVIAFILDTIILYYLESTTFKDNNYKIANIIYVSKLISSSFGLVVSLLLNRYWSFKATHQKLHVQAGLMVCIFIFDIFLSAFIFGIYYEILRAQQIIDFGSASIGISNLLTTCTLIVTNFFLYKKIVFK